MSNYNAVLANAIIVPATEVWPNMDDLSGKFVLKGTIVLEHKDRNLFRYGDDIRTSLIQNIDVYTGIVETMNTRYLILTWKPKEISQTD